MDNIKKELKNMQKALLTGTSYMMPMVVAGGILFSLSLLGGSATTTGMTTANAFMENIKVIGKAGLFMMIPILSAYIAYSLSGRPGLIPGFILGYIANTPLGENEVKTGFLGALIMGLLAGYFVRWLKGLKVHSMLKSIMPILIVPVVSSLVLGLFYIYIIAQPVGFLIQIFMDFLTGLNGANSILFAIIIGVLCEIDFGGPITKTVTMFTIALIAEGVTVPNGIYRVCPGIPPMAICLSTMLFKNKWTNADRDVAKTLGIMGIMGITEGAIPFAIKDAKRIIPSTVMGCVVAAVIASLTGVASPVPHGSFITLPMVTNKVWFCVAIIAGTIVSAVMMGVLRKPVDEKE
jgi:PTS system, fructose subfamily, IIC component